ncbi:hypothetical protein A9K55_000127 [Cordyceps militaris]|uniref:Uncharacterized protein n=1 Tax=Cordyceps militaris TaxID=73501 RepID=A0A2H4SWH9_CORMI|nr:hypothetical protein A9K55_000127 [Cordyceps militaris]
MLWQRVSAAQIPPSVAPHLRERLESLAHDLALVAGIKVGCFAREVVSIADAFYTFHPPKPGMALVIFPKISNLKGGDK